jgi:hypothetical protein
MTRHFGEGSDGTFSTLFAAAVGLAKSVPFTPSFVLGDATLPLWQPIVLM